MDSNIDAQRVALICLFDLVDGSVPEIAGRLLIACLCIFHVRIGAFACAASAGCAGGWNFRLCRHACFLYGKAGRDRQCYIVG